VTAAVAPGRRDVPPPVPPIDVVLVDVRAERLGMMRALFERSGLLAVVGQAATQAEALDAVRVSGAKVVILEIQLPVDEGLATVSALRQAFPDVRIVVCSFHQTAETTRLATESGADAYITKPVDVDALARLLRLPAAARTAAGAPA
jgi:DNA-binding NarL/FixJ family response regulator